MTPPTITVVAPTIQHDDNAVVMWLQHVFATPHHRRQAEGRTERECHAAQIGGLQRRIDHQRKPPKVTSIALPLIKPMRVRPSACSTHAMMSG